MIFFVTLTENFCHLLKSFKIMWSKDIVDLNRSNVNNFIEKKELFDNLSQSISNKSS